jgi:PleD family two-component response regulator
MEAVPRVPRKPVVAIAGQHEWLVRSLESIFGSNGFTAFARVGIDSTEWLGGSRPDLIVIEGMPSEEGWPDRFDRLRRARGVTRATPVIAVTSESLTRARRLDALRAGAWDIFGHPLDAEVLVLKANTFVAAKMEEEDARERSLIDPETDFYNVRGVLRRIYEEASEAARTHRPLACLVTSVESSEAESANPERARQLARALREASRTSDVFGRLGPNEFVVVAPGTDSPGARIFAERLATIVIASDDPAGARALPMRAGFAAIADMKTTDVEPVDLFVRAVAALRAAQASEGDLIRSYD